MKRLTLSQISPKILEAIASFTWRNFSCKTQTHSSVAPIGRRRTYEAHLRQSIVPNV
jgi:hypothetical protein